MAACFDAGKVRKKGAELEHCGRATTATTPLSVMSHGPTQGRLSRGTEWSAARVARSFSLSGDETRKRGIETRRDREEWVEGIGIEEMVESGCGSPSGGARGEMERKGNGLGLALGLVGRCT